MKHLFSAAFLLSALCSGASAQSAWTWRNPLPDGCYQNQALWTGSQALVTGRGCGATSTDGASWTARDLNGVRERTMAWTGTRFVLAGVSEDPSHPGNVMETSTDGITWTLHTSAAITGNDVFAMAWTGSQLVAVGINDNTDTTVVGTSPDGVSWTFHTLPNTGYSQYFSLLWTGSQLVAVGENSNSSGFKPAIATSPDGATWTFRSAPDSVGPLNAVTWTGSQLVAVGNFDALTSPDGVNWTPHPMTDTAGEITAVTWAGSQLVAGTGNGFALTSPDGITWTTRALPIPLFEGIVSVVWTGPSTGSGTGQIIAFGYDNIVTSHDGINWTLRSSAITHAFLNGVAASGTGRLVAVGYEDDNNNGPGLLTSTDGVAWTAIPMANEDALYAVIWSGTRFVAVGVDSAYDGLAMTSPDGITWTPHVLPSGDQLLSVTWTGSQFVAVGEKDTSAFGTSLVMTSPDGATWTQREQGGPSPLLAVAWNGTRLVAAGGGILAISTDGVNWTFPPLPGAMLQLSALTPMGGAQIAGVGLDTSGHVLASITTDGVNWTSHALAADVNQQPVAVAWTGSQLVAAGYNGALFTSPDGATWTSRSSGTMGQLMGLTWTGSQLVMVGENGTIFTSPTGTSAIFSPSPPRLQDRVFLRVTPTQLLATLPVSMHGSNAKAAIYTLSGDKVLETSVGTKSSFMLPIGNLAHGKYLLEVNSQNGRAAQPFTIRR